MKVLPPARANLFRASKRGKGGLAVSYADSLRFFRQSLLPEGSGSGLITTIDSLSFGRLVFTS